MSDVFCPECEVTYRADSCPSCGYNDSRGMSAEHTPTPWVRSDKALGTHIQGPNGEHVAAPLLSAGVERAQANSELIVRAVNSYAAHERVVEAARRSLSWLSSYPGGGADGAYDDLRAALAALEE